MTETAEKDSRICCKACPERGEMGGLLLGSEGVKEQHWTSGKVIFRKLFPQLMDGVCFARKAGELVTSEAWQRCC